MGDPTRDFPDGTDRRRRRDCGGHTARREPDPARIREHDNGLDGYRCIYCGSNVNDWPDQPCVERPASGAEATDA